MSLVYTELLCKVRLDRPTLARGPERLRQGLAYVKQLKRRPFTKTRSLAHDVRSDDQTLMLLHCKHGAPPHFPDFHGFARMQSCGWQALRCHYTVLYNLRGGQSPHHVGDS